MGLFRQVERHIEVDCDAGKITVDDRGEVRKLSEVIDVDTVSMNFANLSPRMTETRKIIEAQIANEPPIR